jgi:hypothetical protein
MPAYARLAAASALAVSFFLSALPAVAADLYEPPYDIYGEGPPPPRDRYADVPDDFEPPYPPRYAERGCIPREEARDRLRDAGWYDFHALEPREDVVLVKARRGRGRLFDLTIDRCTGEIVDAKPLHARRWGPYALGPRRHWAPY